MALTTTTVPAFCCCCADVIIDGEDNENAGGHRAGLQNRGVTDCKQHARHSAFGALLTTALTPLRCLLLPFSASEFFDFDGELMGWVCLCCKECSC